MRISLAGTPHSRRALRASLRSCVTVAGYHSGERVDDDDTKQSSATAARREQIQTPKDALLRVFLLTLLQHQSATDALGQAISSVNPKGVENAAVDAYSFLVAGHSVLRRLDSIEHGAPDDMQTARFAI